jgi:hypothetical protein
MLCPVHVLGGRFRYRTVHHLSVWRREFAPREQFGSELGGAHVEGTPSSQSNYIILYLVSFLNM